ncbi:MAG: F510_1955 family glycosylhydrolase [Dermatophilaceae bacterium]
MSRTARKLVIPMIAAAVVLALTACGSSTAAGTIDAKGDSVKAGALPGEHVHVVARNPGDGKVYLATHHGLYRYDKGNPVLVGPEVDYMGFSVAGPGHFYASGHPADGVDLPAPVGLMESVDAGKTWSVKSLGGEADFHALTSSSKGILGYDGTLMTSVDGKSWSKGSITAPPSCLAAAPDGSKTLATTESGVLLSTDQGATWAPLTSAPKLLTAAWADNTTAAGITPTGAIAITTDAGATWTTGKAKVDSIQSISASRTTSGNLEVLVVTNTAVQRSLDSGATLTPLGTN